MEPIAYIERIKKNRKGIGKHLNLRSITLAWSPLDASRESRQSGMEYEQNLNLGSITLAWSSLDTLRESRTKRNGIQTKNLNLGYIALAWGPLHTLRESRNNQMEYEQNMNLGSITLAWAPWIY